MISSHPRPIWEPRADFIHQTRVWALMQRLNIASWAQLQQFSTHEQDTFWDALWRFMGILGERRGPAYVPASDGAILKARFFPESTLNFAQNCLRRRDESVAMYFKDEGGAIETLTWAQLYARVERLAHFLKNTAALQKGDRVCAMLPNCPQAVIAFLACTALGLVFSSCSPDFGEDGVIDRFDQIKPKVFVVCDGAIYNGRPQHNLEKINVIISHIDSLQHVILVPFIHAGTPPDASVPVHVWPHLVEEEHHIESLSFVPLPFSHPAAILYSSGTTGKPKCIVHSTGGMLLQLMKEHQLHCDIKPDNKVFYFTTCGWMMWNWLVAALASQATLCLYDGSPKHPGDSVLFDYVDAVGINHLGVSAKLISIWNKDGFIPKNAYSLSSLRMILSTGSPLLEREFQYVYQFIKEDVILTSISGGTDIASCFVLGCPILPVYAGQIQTAGLGLAVDVYTEKGESAPVGEKGELVCTKPFIAMPVGFYNDPDGHKYRETYYEHFPNVWYHGDFAQKTPEGGFIIYGRSDATLKPGGIRIGTAEIYAQVEKSTAIREALVVGQNWMDDVRVILFVIMEEKALLSDSLIATLKKNIRENVSPHHVPAKIIAVPDFPRTRSGKLSELLVRDLINNTPPKNLGAIANPESLQHFQNLKDLQD